MYDNLMFDFFSGGGQLRGMVSRIMDKPKKLPQFFWSVSSSLTHCLKNFQDVTHLKNSPQLARLIVKFLRVGSPKRKVYLFVILVFSSYFKSFKPYS